MVICSMGAGGGEESKVRTLCTQHKDHLDVDVHVLKSILLKHCLIHALEIGQGDHRQVEDGRRAWHSSRLTSAVAARSADGSCHRRWKTEL